MALQGTPPAQQQQVPIIKDTKRVNCPFIISEPDADGNREISFIVGAAELETFVVSAQASVQFAQAFSGGIKTATLADVAAVTKNA